MKTQDVLLTALIELLDDWQKWVTSVPHHPSRQIGRRAARAIALAQGKKSYALTKLKKREVVRRALCREAGVAP